jgi:serine/threonine-protein kinase
VADEDAIGALPEGTLVGGRFKTERLIGRGGMGEVYAARHATTGKQVALKLIHATSGSSKEHVRRFLREARAATAIEHPNVIQVFDVFEDENGTPVMVMELLKGEPFSAYRERAGALELWQTAEVLLPVARALVAAHAKGIVHRDLKPDNVFLAETPAGRLTKLLDFGIAKVLDPARIGSETQGQNTNTGSILGTPDYMSFEQAMSDKQVDHRTDIWAMGVMIFESLTGRRPMTYDSLGQMYAAFLQGTIPSIREFVPDLPDDAAQVFDHCLGKQREERLGDLAPLIEILVKYADPNVPGAHVGGHVVAAPVAPRTTASVAALARSVTHPSVRRRSRTAMTTIALLVLVGLGLGAGVLAMSHRTAARVADSLPSTVKPTSGTDPAASSTPPVAPPPVVSAPETTAQQVASAAPRVRRAPSSPTTTAPRPSSQPPAPPEPSAAKRGISDKLPY